MTCEMRLDYGVISARKGGDGDRENQTIGNCSERFANDFALTRKGRRADKTVERRKDYADELEY